MYQPFGFRDKTHPNHVFLLHRSLYGLKQAPRAWYQRFGDYAKSIGFVNSKCDHSLFIYHHGQDVAYLLLYVDDIVLTTSSEQLRLRLMSSLSREFAMKNLGPLHSFLGINVTRSSNGLFLSQAAYAKTIIERAGLEGCNPVSTPVDADRKLGSKQGRPYADSTKYRSLAGALQYLTFTRPDISYAVQQVCLHMHDPKEVHMNAFTSSCSTDLIAYTDADWGGCPDTRRSTSGYCVYYGDNLISWSSKRQTTMSRSSAEAEYRGVANVVAESCWLRNLLLELHSSICKATLVFCDNMSAIYLSGNPVHHQRTKHIEMDIHFVREKVAKGQQYGITQGN
ncbi:uncharacterized mitochondrial protein AtMg00810-like [Rutidosis leptorrhynchoides]|uniref:uncharacterized mitochondrial protein AtMg00810-like n=1 Tax=Rutidosis leptorrhynchoides TaxID=125765 RepID=UPI003A9A3992